MSSRGNKFLGGYWRFIGRWIRAYVIGLCMLLAALLLFDALFPQHHVYSALLNAMMPDATPAPAAAK